MGWGLERERGTGVNVVTYPTNLCCPLLCQNAVPKRAFGKDLKCCSIYNVSKLVFYAKSTRASCSIKTKTVCLTAP